MNYKTFQSHSDLNTLIKCYWTLTIPKEAPKGRQQILPDGCMDLIFNLGDDVKRYLVNDEYLIQPKSFLLGQISQPFWIEPLGLVDTFAVRFNPGCFSYFTEASMSGLANKETELDVLFESERITQLVSEIVHAKDTTLRIEIIEQFLFELLDKLIDVDDLLRSTIDKICLTNGTLGVNEMLQHNQNQRRQLERKFSKQVGLSPKQLCRVIRLQASLKAMLDEDKSLTSIGYESDFFDQAHFIKDFKDFTGVSPKEFYINEAFTLSSILYAKE